MKLATPEAFARDPETVLAFYDARRQNLMNAKPNAAHFALARLERGLAAQGRRLTLVTQNIDDLHERAGSREVVHMHGELMKARCLDCGAVRVWPDDLSLSHACPRLRLGPVLAPACRLVRRNAAPHGRHRPRACASPTCSSRSAPRARSILRRASSPRRAPMAFATCEINLEAADNADCFDEARYGPASETVPAWVEEFLGA